MSVNVINLGASALELDIHGKVEEQDFEHFVPIAEERIAERGQIGLLVNVSDFEGYSASGLWEDLKFDVKHYSDVSRLALVSSDPSDKWMATVSKPFTAADVKFFSTDQLDNARQWVQTA